MAFPTPLRNQTERIKHSSSKYLEIAPKTPQISPKQLPKDTPGVSSGASQPEIRTLCDFYGIWEPFGIPMGRNRQKRLSGNVLRPIKKKRQENTDFGTLQNPPNRAETLARAQFSHVCRDPEKSSKIVPKQHFWNHQGYKNGLEAVGSIDQRPGTGKREPKRLPKGMDLVRGTLVPEASRAR